MKEHEYVFAEAMVLVFMLVMVPRTAQAGIFSNIGAWFSTNAEASVTHVLQSVQTMPLLTPAMNVNPHLARGGGDVTIVDEEAVVPDEGPAGTIADIMRPQNSEISIYVVREGDTLSGIAEMFHVSVNTIRWANNISPRGTIRVGQTLTILPITSVKHTVKKGDTVASIAKQYDADADEIINFNKIEGSLVAGKELIIPNGEIAQAPAARTTKAHESSGAPVSSYTGYYIRPIAGGTRTQGIHGYNGIDVAAPVGTPVLASAAGDVIVSKEGGWNGGYGSYVVIRHDNGTQTLYAHASSVIVGVGQRVVQGQVIGYVGATGKATGPHVHFEIRGGPRNPF